MTDTLHNCSVPDVILLIGTDAVGKDHVANILMNMIHEAGYVAEKRHRFLSTRIRLSMRNENKTPWELFLEWLFLEVYPSLGFLLPPIINRLLRRELKIFKQSDRKIIVVGHNYLRGLAFYWERRYSYPEQINVPTDLDRTLTDLGALSGLYPMVISVDEKLRKERIVKRILNGKADFFDRYMIEDSDRAQRIQTVLRWMVQKYLKGRLLENNDLSEPALRKYIVTAFLTDD
jgi:hypothetical protein